MGALRQPTANQLRFMRAIVVPGEMRVEFCGHVALDGMEKAVELAGAVTAMELAQHPAAGHLEGREQASGAVAYVFVSAALGLSGRMGSSGAERSGSSRPHTEPGRGRAGEIKAKDVADFVENSGSRQLMLNFKE